MIPLKLCFYKNLDPLILILTEESGNAIAICKSIVNRLGKFKNTLKISIDKKQILFANSVTLLGLQNDNKLNFNFHIFTL